MALAQLSRPVTQCINVCTKPLASIFIIRKESSGKTTLPATKIKLNSLPREHEETYPVDNEFYKIPFKNSFEREVCESRREWVEQITGTNMDNCSSWWTGQNTDPTLLKGNIENCIGLVKIPLGVAGPIHFSGKHAKGSIMAPMATTEGVLVAAICRGAKALNLSGGVKTWATHQRMNRAPFFVCDNPDQAVTLGEWIINNKDRIQQEVISKHSNHAKLREIFCIYDKSILHANFRYETGDAAGQNQTTTVTYHAQKWIIQEVEKVYTKDELDIHFHMIDGNMSGDKKASGLNGVHGRGISVTAEVDIPESVLNEICGVDSKTMAFTTEYASRISSRSHCHNGHNANVSNLLAGVFAATGQDIACVAESSIATFGVNLRDHPEGGVHLSMYMPCLVVGTVGGGTSLPTQRECLEMMGCYGSGKVMKLAEILAGYCLALDLATWSAICGGFFAASHEQMGRNKPNH